MKTIEWTDEKGFNRKRVIQDRDSDENAKDGIPLEPPDLNRLDWEELKATLHNELMNRSLVNWKDVQASQDGVTSAILATFKRKVVMLYKQEV